MSFEVRALQPEDHDVWESLWRSYQAFYDVDIAASVTAVTWARLLALDEPMGGAVAVAQGRPVGLAHWIVHRSCWTIGDYCYLQDLFVTGDLRGRGIGRMLIEYVYELARSAGWSRVHWLTQATNIDAMALYDRIGDRSGFVQYRKLFEPLERPSK